MNKFIVLTGIILGAIAIMQFNATFLDLPENSPAQEKIDQEAVMTQLQQERNELQQDFRKTIQAENEKRKTINPQLSQELNKIQNTNGLTEKEGKGVIFKLEALSAKYTPEKQVRDLQNLINILNSIKAEGVSINGYRVVFRSAFSWDGSNIFLDQNLIKSPFEIKAIGNPSFITAAIKNQTDFIKNLQAEAKDNKINFEFQQTDYISIPAYLR